MKYMRDNEIRSGQEISLDARKICFLEGHQGRPLVWRRHILIIRFLGTSKIVEKLWNYNKDHNS